MDGRTDQLVERFGGLEVEVVVLRVADEEPVLEQTALQVVIELLLDEVR